MTGKKSVIETGVDKLVRLVSERKKISVKDAAKELGVSTTSIEEWSDFLEEDGIISIQTQFATVYLVEKQIGKKELVEKVKAVKDQKEEFLRRVDSSINALARDHEEIKLIDSEFREIKSLLGENFSKLNKKLEKLQDFRKSHKDIELKKKEIEEEYEKKVRAVEAKLADEQKQYAQIIAGIEEELEKIRKERDMIAEMKSSEKELQSRMGEINHMIEQAKQSIEKENAQLELDEKRLNSSEDLARKIKDEMKLNSKVLGQVSEQVKVSRKDLEKLEREFIHDVESMSKGDIEKIGPYAESKQVIDKFKRFFDRTKEVEDIIQSAEKEESELRDLFEKMVRKADAFSVMTSAPEVRGEVESLRKSLQEIESRKTLLASQLKKLRSLVRSVIE
jgi:predicted ArsR family transcriptional regulator